MERVVIFERYDGRWDWHLVGGNNEIMAGSTQGYESFSGAMEGFDRTRHALEGIVDIVTKEKANDS